MSTIQLPINTLRAALLFAAKEDVRYYLVGVRIKVEPSGLAQLHATDGHRLLIARIPAVLEDAAELDVILPRDAVEAMLKTKGLAKAAPTIELQVTGDKFSFRGAGVEMSGALIDGRYPDVTRVVSAPNGQPAQFNWQYLADCQTAHKLLTGSAYPPVVGQNGDGPALVLLGDDAFAVVMPCRGKQPDALPAWFAGEPAPAKAAA